MKQEFKTHTVTVFRKPKGFKLVGNDIYEYEIIFKVEKSINLVFPQYDYYTEKVCVPYKYLNKKTTNKSLDFLAFNRKVKQLTGIILNDKVENINVEMFRRDGGLLPFVESVIVPPDQTEQYIQYKELRDRIEKINKLKNNIK